MVLLLSFLVLMSCSTLIGYYFLKNETVVHKRYILLTIQIIFVIISLKLLEMYFRTEEINELYALVVVGVIALIVGLVSRPSSMEGNG